MRDIKWLLTSRVYAYRPITGGGISTRKFPSIVVRIVSSELSILQMSPSENCTDVIQSPSNTSTYISLKKHHTEMPLIQREAFPAVWTPPFFRVSKLLHNMYAYL